MTALSQHVPLNAKTQPTITLYGPEICPLCDKAIAMFQRSGIPYTKVVIEKGDPNYTYVTETLGYTTAPVIIVEIDGAKIHWGGHRVDMLMAVKRLFTNFKAAQEEVSVEEKV